MVLRADATDERATRLARAIDARLGGGCPRRIRLPPRPDTSAAKEARLLATACVHASVPSYDREHGPLARTLTDGLVEVASQSAIGQSAIGSAPSSPNGADVVTLRSLARLAFARGLLSEAVFGPASATSPLFQSLEDSTPPSLDPDTRRGIGLAVVEHLLSRPGVDLRAVRSLAIHAARFGTDEALDRAPFHTDGATLFARVRADALSYRPPRAPGLSLVEHPKAGAIVVQFDAPLQPSPSELVVCGKPYDGIPTASGDGLLVSFDESTCVVVDGIDLVTVEVSGLSTSPRGLDGAIVGHAFARAESDSGSPDHSPDE